MISKPEYTQTAASYDYDKNIVLDRYILMHGAQIVYKDGESEVERDTMDPYLRIVF